MEQGNISLFTEISNIISKPPPPQIKKVSRQEVRTKRYITVVIEGLDISNKKVILSWFESRNGIPLSCYILVPGSLFSQTY